MSAAMVRLSVWIVLVLPVPEKNYSSFSGLLPTKLSIQSKKVWPDMVVKLAPPAPKREVFFCVLSKILDNLE